MYGAVLICLAALCAGVLVAAWALGAEGGMTQILVGLVLWLIWSMFAFQTWRGSPVGQLKWSALERFDPTREPGTWRWLSASCPEGAPVQRVERMVDLQSVMLLRLHNADGLARWIWVERACDPSRWNDLRRALMRLQGRHP